MIKTLKSKELNDDYNEYFQQLLNEITSALEHVNTTVIDYNSKYGTAFTSDLYETFFTSSLKNFINSLNDLYQKVLKSSRVFKIIHRLTKIEVYPGFTSFLLYYMNTSLKRNLSWLQIKTAGISLIQRYN